MFYFILIPSNLESVKLKTLSAHKYKGQVSTSTTTTTTTLSSSLFAGKNLFHCGSKAVRRKNVKECRALHLHLDPSHGCFSWHSWH